MSSENKKQFVTSLRINPEIWKDAKVAAIQNDMTLTELVEEAISCWIKMKEDMKTENKR
jgi:predicted HicB family RNase H-like nuclease